MSVFRHIGNRLSFPPDTPELVLAQWRAVSRQVPLLYAMLMCNTLIVAWTHFEVAPTALAVHIPAALTALCIIRSVQWWRSQDSPITVEQARRGLGAMVWIAAAMALGFVAWSFSLFPYGDAYLRSQIAFFLGITTIGCMFCLMHVRAAALAVGLCALVPFFVFFLAWGEQTLIAIAVNMVLVIAGLLVILLANNRDFAALVASRSDMARRQAETQRLFDENYRLANIDSLTNLPNRRSFERRLTLALRQAEDAGQSVAAARLDLDRFKSVNEIFGQLAGDRVLIEVARRLDALCQPDIFVARMGGNSFGLVLPGPADDETLARHGEKFCEAMRETFELPEGVVRLSASVGLAASRPGDTPHELFERADNAASIAKREARGAAVVFAERHWREIDQARRMEHLLHTADLDEEIYVLLQPQFDISLGATTGFEALARWRSPVLGEISPAQFIPLAERSGQIGRITRAVLRKALAASAHLPRPLRLSVNLSAHDIGSSTAIEQIVALVAAHGSPCRIDFEITETAVMRDLKQANQSLLALLGLGARIALDDFGTGHSSLTHVQKLPLHRIKIDRSFVVEVTSDPASRAIVKTMIDLSRNLGISCVFEGIETEEQLEALVALGGHVMQGYLFGRPMRPEEVGEYLARERSLRQLETRAVSRG